MNHCEFWSLCCWKGGGDGFGNNQYLTDFAVVEIPPINYLWFIQYNNSQKEPKKKKERTSNVKGENLLSPMGKAKRRTCLNYHQYGEWTWWMLGENYERKTADWLMQPMYDQTTSYNLLYIYNFQHCLSRSGRLILSIQETSQLKTPEQREENWDFLAKVRKQKPCIFYRNKVLLNSQQNDSPSPHFPWSLDFPLSCI